MDQGRARRRSSRFDARAIAHPIRLDVDQGTVLKGTMHDLARHGCAVLLETVTAKEVTTGRTVTLTTMLPTFAAAESELVQIVATVVGCVPNADGATLVRLRFEPANWMVRSRIVRGVYALARQRDLRIQA